jgi:prolyl-tRNA synthetase
MSHGDDNGLVMPPDAAPVQVVIVPVAQEKAGVLERAFEIKGLLAEAGIRVSLDDSDKSSGWKFAEHEMRGVPVRLELGPRDLANNQAVLARRDTGAKETAALDGIVPTVTGLLADIKKSMYERALARMNAKTYTAKNMDEFEKTINDTPGFIKAMWCGGDACEEAIKERTSATSRCIPFEQEHIADTCVFCGKKADTMVYWAKA